MLSIKKNSFIFFRIQIFISILLLATACGIEEIKQIEKDIKQEKVTDVQYAIENFDISILLEAANLEIRKSAESLVLKAASLPEGVTSFYWDPDARILPGLGCTITVGANGIFTGTIPVRIAEYYYGTVLGTGQIQGNGSTGGSGEIVLGAHLDKNSNQRYLLLEYFDTKLNIWTYLDIYAQDAISIEFKSNMEENIPQAGATYVISQLSDYPAVYPPDMARFRAVTTNDIQISSNSVMMPPVKNTNIQILRNDDPLPRIVYLQFYIEDIGEWITFESALQLGTGTSSNIITLSKVELCGIEPTGGYIHVYVWGDPTELNAGDQIPIRIKGFNNVLLTTTTIVEGTATWGATLPNLYPHASTGYHGSTVLEIPTLENNGWGAYYQQNLDQRYTPYIRWSFEYYDGEQWRGLDPTFGQNNYFLGVNNTATILTAGGGYWNLLVTGSFPAGLIVFRAVNEFNTVISNANFSLPALAGGNQATVVPISISPNNTGSIRYVYLEYSINGGAFTKWNKNVSPTPYWSGNNYIIQTN